MTVTDEELAAKRERVAKLRQQLRSATSTRVSREQDQVNVVAATQLDAEEARLLAELSRAKEASKVGAVREGAATVIQPAATELVAAKEQQKAADTAAKAAASNYQQ